MIARVDYHMDPPHDHDDVAEDGFWGLNSVIEEYHRSRRRTNMRSGNHLVSVPPSAKFCHPEGEPLRVNRQ